MVAEKEVEYKGEKFIVKSLIWSRYVDFVVNGEQQNLGVITTDQVENLNDFKSYAKQAIERFIETRRAKAALASWNGSL
jgi:hypothetical protein